MRAIITHCLLFLGARRMAHAYGSTMAPIPSSYLATPACADPSSLLQTSNLSSFSLSNRSGLYLLWYLILFNLPVLCIILYLFTHDKKTTHYQPVHFEKKPRSFGFVSFPICRVILCEDPKLFAIDEYTDEIESSKPVSAVSAFCWRDLEYRERVREEVPVDASFVTWIKAMFKRYLTRQWTMKTVIQSPLGYLSATGGVVNVVSRNGTCGK